METGEGIFTKELIDKMLNEYKNPAQTIIKPSLRSKYSMLLAEYMNRRLSLISIPECRGMSNQDLLYGLLDSYKYRHSPFEPWITAGT
jgi:hypothetical protein